MEVYGEDMTDGSEVFELFVFVLGIFAATMALNIVLAIAWTKERAIRLKVEREKQRRKSVEASPDKRNAD